MGKNKVVDVIYQSSFVFSWGVFLSGAFDVDIMIIAIGLFLFIIAFDYFIAGLIFMLPFIAYFSGYAFFNIYWVFSIFCLIAPFVYLFLRIIYLKFIGLFEAENHQFKSKAKENIEGSEKERNKLYLENQAMKKYIALREKEEQKKEKIVYKRYIEDWKNISSDDSEREMHRKEGFKFEHKFEEMCATEHGILLEYIEQSAESMQKYKDALDERVKRPDFFVHNIVGKKYIELKRYSVQYSENNTPYFLFQYWEMKGLERFLDQVHGEEMYILFSDQNKAISEENIQGITLKNLIKKVLNRDFPVIKKNYIRVFLSELKGFDAFENHLKDEDFIDQKASDRWNNK